LGGEKLRGEKGGLWVFSLKQKRGKREIKKKKTTLTEVTAANKEGKRAGIAIGNLSSRTREKGGKDGPTRFPIRTIIVAADYGIKKQVETATLCPHNRKDKPKQNPPTENLRE